uniref:Fatty acyl-CoA reductase C-terminal domain-containing protein n=1 Tax=Timema monikensis TaxID=170555 RepID=A0A7R9HQF3_9NEOP|nr:unnamed protein product [Timema monikensis]
MRKNHPQYTQPGFKPRITHHWPNNILVYNCTSGSLNPIRWGDIESIGHECILKNPFSNVLWYPGGSFKSSRLLNMLCVLVFHSAPAYLFDMVARISGKKPMGTTRNKTVSAIYGEHGGMVYESTEMAEAIAVVLEKQFKPNDEPQDHDFTRDETRTVRDYLEGQNDTRAEGNHSGRARHHYKVVQNKILRTLTGADIFTNNADLHMMTNCRQLQEIYQDRNKKFYDHTEMHENELVRGLQQYDLTEPRHRKRPRLAMVRVHDKLQRAVSCLEFFTTHEWRFTNDNMTRLMARLHPRDRKIFNFDIADLDWKVYWEQYVLGTRKFILKEDPSTFPAARSHLRK